VLVIERGVVEREDSVLAALDVVRIGVEKGARAGFDAEALAVAELATSPTAKQLIHLFGLMEASKKDGAGDSAPPPPVLRPAVLGAGVMGGGIAHLVADKAALPVRLKDLQPAAITTALQHAARLFDKQVRRRRLLPAEMHRRMALLQPTQSWQQVLAFGGAKRCRESPGEDRPVRKAWRHVVIAVRIS
jgi:3-hydroxyacyl-CoA dehydrogenase/enoyl-CoA hydratase/3-hydroxybutyryl-CoA epimerase